jgi:NAD(P)H-hydrate epimerase
MIKPLSRAVLRSFLAPRRPDDHKGKFGHALIVAGSRNMAGAAILCARGALRSGSGLVTLAVPRSLQKIVCGQVPEALTLGLPESPNGTLQPSAVAVLAAAHKKTGYDVLAVGCGLSQEPGTVRFVWDLLGRLDLPAVVDADALNALSRQPEKARRLFHSRKSPAILTPHPGEMGRLLKISARKVNARRHDCAQGLAKSWGVVVILKGRHSVIASSARCAINRTGGSGLARGGTGDVLTGLTGGLWAQSLALSQKDSAFEAAALGAHLHGLAGDLAESILGARAMTAQDVVNFLPPAFLRL